MNKLYLMLKERKGTPGTGDGECKRRGRSRAEKGPQNQRSFGSQVPILCVGRAGWTVILPATLGHQASTAPRVGKWAQPSGAPPTHAHVGCARTGACTLPIAPRPARACKDVRAERACACACVQSVPCVRVRAGSDRAGPRIRRSPAALLLAAHQNSIEQFRSGNKGCVIITSYW